MRPLAHTATRRARVPTGVHPALAGFGFGRLWLGPHRPAAPDATPRHVLLRPGPADVATDSRRIPV